MSSCSPVHRQADRPRTALWLALALWLLALLPGPAAAGPTCHGRFMNPITVHSFSAVFGQKGRVNIDNTPVIGFNHTGRHKFQISGQGYIIDAAFLELVQKVPVSSFKRRVLFPDKNKSFNVFLFGPL